jgi:hypothetical protein
VGSGSHLSGNPTSREFRQTLGIIRASYCWNGARCFLDSQSDLVSQIERLSRDVFWTKSVAALLFLCLAVGNIANWTRHPRTVEANEFLLKDRSGNVVARLGQYDFGITCLTLTANQHVSVADLCVQNDEGTSLDLHNLKSESRATLTPGFNLYEPLSHIKPDLVISEHGQVIGRISSRAPNTPD